MAQKKISKNNETLQSVKIIITEKNQEIIDRTIKLLIANGISEIEVQADPMSEYQVENEHKYLSVIENQQEMIARWTPSGKIVFSNSSFQKLHQLNDSQLEKVSYYDLVKDKVRFAEKIKLLSVDNSSLTDVHDSPDSTGKKCWYEWTDQAFFNEQGDIIEFQSTGRNITRQTEAELEIKAREVFLQSVFSAIQDSIVVIDGNGKILATNESWKKFAAENSADALKTDVGVNYFDVCKSAINTGDDLAGEILNGIKSVVKAEQPFYEREYPCHSDSVSRWFVLRATQLLTENGGAVITHTDITEKKNRDIELQLSYKEILSNQQINHALITGESTHVLADKILQGLYDVTHVLTSRIYLYEKSTHQLNLYAHQLPEDVKSAVEKKTGKEIVEIIPELTEGTIINQVIADKKIFITNNPSEIRQLIEEHAINKDLKKLVGWADKFLNLKTFGLYPLLRGSEVIGLLSISSPLLLSEKDQGIVLRFSQRASLAFSKKLDQETLLKNKAKFKAISNYTANWEIWVDETGKPIWMNPAVFYHTGYTADELIQAADFYKMIVHKDDHDAFMKILSEALAHKTEGGNLEARCNHKNGSTPWFSISWKQVYDSDGKWIGIRSSATDITESKKNQRALIQKTKELKEAQSIAKLGQWEWNSETEIFTLSENLCSIIGLNPDQNELTKEKLFYLIHRDSYTTLEQTLISGETHFNPKDIEIRLWSLSGDDKYLLIRSRETDSKIDNQRKIQGTALDITELKQAHLKSKENQEKFQKIFESIEDIYFQANQAGIITLISPSVYQLTQFDHGSIADKPLTMLYTKPGLDEIVVLRKDDNTIVEQFETKLNSNTGDEIIVSVNLTHYLDESEGIFKTQGILRNITLSKRQERHLERQRKRLLEIVKLNTQIIETSDHFYYVIKTSEQKKAQSKLKYISPQVNQILGINETELLNNKNQWHHLIHPDDLSKVKATVSKIFTDKTPQRVSYRVKHNQTGKFIWVDDHACPLLNSNDEVIEIYGSVKDVTDRINSIIKITAEKKQSMALQYQLLSSQLTPHFIYNTLNSFQYYILQGNVEESLNHISEFSLLMRRVLENSMRKYITIDEEISFLQQYIRISQQRMSQPLSFIVQNPDNVETSELLIPPMLLQPYLENAIIHGFINTSRLPEIKFILQKRKNRIECIIEDNGIGRVMSQSLKRKMPSQKTNSYGIGINNERIDLLNQLSENNFQLQIQDMYDTENNATGTRVIISMNCICENLD